MGPTLSPETSAFKLQTPGKFPEEYKVHSEHGESLKTTSSIYVFPISTQTLQLKPPLVQKDEQGIYEKNVLGCLLFHLIVAVL